MNAAASVATLAPIASGAIDLLVQSAPHFKPPSTILDGPVRDLLDTFSYGRADATVSWVAPGLADGSLKAGYRAHAPSRGALESGARKEIARIIEARILPVANLNSPELGVLVEWAYRAAGSNFTLTYPVSGDDGSAVMRAADGWTGEAIHWDRTRRSLAHIGRKHAEVVAEVRTWDVWRRLKSPPLSAVLEKSTPSEVLELLREVFKASDILTVTPQTDDREAAQGCHSRPVASRVSSRSVAIVPIDQAGA